MNPLVIFKDVSTFFKMAGAILRRQYKMPWQTLFWAVICMLYFASPIDLLPDVLPMLGIADDGAFILFVLTLLHKDLAAFRQTQEDKSNVIEAEVVQTFDKKDKE
ncbi:MAG: DUF1232 domain-containing protein [Elusimicrobiaceae bacterium]|nr:DUF1232 domain-containing protein [Elusimicrobiaceae bacterium]